VKYDFNVLEKAARELFERGLYRDALRIYYFMSDGDASLDAGYLGEKLGECYEALGELQAAKYWSGRAVEENPAVRTNSAAALSRLADVSIDDLLPSKT
jgi:tetratricopeptide (TPR) repeat protein